MTGAARGGDAHRREEIEVRIPADPAFRRLGRLAAADVATRAGFDLEKIDDLRIAVDELSAAVVGPEPTVSRTLVLRFTFSSDVVEVVGHCDGSTRPRLDDLSRAICAAVVDEYRLDVVDGARWFRLSKRAAP